MFLLITSMAEPLYSQVAIGANASITRMKFSGDPPKGFGFFTPQAGYATGLSLDFRLHEAFSISFQPSYSVLRSKYSIANDSGTAVIDSTNFKMSSFSLPLSAVVWSENGRFYVLAGFELSYTLDFEGKTHISPLTSSSEIYEIEKFIIYAHFGAGFIVPLGKPYLNFEFRYSQGLNDLTVPLIHQDTFLPRTKLTNMYFTVGFHLPLGKSDVYELRKSR